MGIVKEYLMWHQDKYDCDPEDMSSWEEFRKDLIEERKEFFGKKLTEKICAELTVESPSIKIIKDIRNNIVDLCDIGWREFEEIVATLLEKNGYKVNLGKGTKDGGVDIFAEQHIPGIGQILTVWQAKKWSKKNKVGISVIRELADTASENKASKGIVVTSSYLTSGAIKRIQKDRYKLGKMDRDDLINDIMKHDF